MSCKDPLRIVVDQIVLRMLIEAVRERKGRFFLNKRWIRKDKSLDHPLVVHLILEVNYFLIKIYY